MSLLWRSRLSHQRSRSWEMQQARRCWGVAERCWSGGAEVWAAVRSGYKGGTGRASSSTILSISHGSGAPSP